VSDRACAVCSAPLGSPVLEGRDRMFSVPGTFTVAECGRCGLAVTEPRLSGHVLASHYPEDYEPYRPPSGALARLFAANRRWQSTARLRRPPFNRLGDAGRLLDVGCGRGDLGAAFRRSGWEVAGVDPSESAVEAARHLGIDARTGTIEDAPWPDRSFDAVVFNHSLEHVPDPVDALRHAVRLVRPGGRVAVVVPDWGSWQRRRFGSRWFHLDLPRHLQHFDAHALEEAVRRAGLAPVAAGTSISASGLWGSIQYALFDECVFRGASLRLALLSLLALYPLTAAIGLVRGGDWLHVVAVTGPGRAAVAAPA
jgi:SAM-dependent methyltransferase